MQVSPLPFVSSWYVMWSVFNNHVCFYFLDFNLLNWYLSLDSLMRSSPTATRTRWVSRTSPLYLDQISFDPRWRTQSLSWKVQRVVTNVMTEFMVKKKSLQKNWNLTCLHNISFTEWNIYKLQDRDTRIQGLNPTIKHFGALLIKFHHYVTNFRNSALNKYIY